MNIEDSPPYQIGEALRTELLKLRGQDQIDFMSAYTGVPAKVLDEIIDKGIVNRYYVSFEFIRQGLTQESKARILNEAVEARGGKINEQAIS